jgi:hypothetical protein
MEQIKNSSRLRNKRVQKTLNERNRKERTRRLIERGAILEQYLEHAEEITNDGISEILKILLTTDWAKGVINEHRERKSVDTGLSVTEAGGQGL